MKQFLIIIMLSFAQATAYGINEYQLGDTLFVIARTGLNLRSDPGLKGKILTTIPYRHRLIMKEEKPPYPWLNTDSVQIFESHHWYKAKNETTTPYWIKGKWAKVEYNGTEGYVFDGYLSKNEPLSKNENGGFESFEDYIRRNYTLEDSIQAEYDSYPDYRSTKLEFGSGCIIEYGTTTKTGWKRIFIYDFSIEEALLFLEYLNANKTRDDTILLISADDKEGKYFFYGEISSVEVKVIGSLIAISYTFWC